MLGERFLVDEQTCFFQVHSEYKVHCGKHKQIHGGLQVDSSADNGYTYERGIPDEIKNCDDFWGKGRLGLAEEKILAFNLELRNSIWDRGQSSGWKYVRPGNCRRVAAY